MRDLTLDELDAQLAEQLPTRELMTTVIVVKQFHLNVHGYDNVGIEIVVTNNYS